MSDLDAYLVVGGVAAGATFVLTFIVRFFAVRLGAVVQPDDRRVHLRPTPTAGGAGMFLAFLIAMVVASQLQPFKDAGVFTASSRALGVVLAAGVIFAVGLLDDLREVSAPAKVSGQVLAATVLYFFGVTILYFYVPFGGFLILSLDLIPLATVLWVVVIANAVNIIDGLDGLAAGIVAIASAAFFLYGRQLLGVGLIEADSIAPLLAAIACGVCVGFLPHNVHPARIFMGDAGAMLLGLLLAASTMLVGGNTPGDQFSGQTFFFYAPVAIPFVILGVPIIDTAFAIIRRAARRKNLSAGDKEHLHHRLMRLGHGHRRSVVILWLWTAILSGLVLYPTITNRGNAVIPAGVAALAVLLYTLFHPGIRQARANGRGEEPDELDEPIAAGDDVDAAVPAAPILPITSAASGGGPPAGAPGPERGDATGR